MAKLDATINASGAKRGANQFNSAVDSMKKRSTSASVVLANFAKRLSYIAFTATAASTAFSIKTYMSFENEMRRVNSVVSGTSETMARLSQVARDAGETTKFTATEAASGLYELAAAGLSANQQATSLKNTLFFAGAAAVPLKQTAEILTSTINQFNLTARDSGRITNTLAAAISTSRASADRLQESLRYIGPIAGTMNVSLEDSVAVLAKLYDAGLEGSMAGTTLRNAIIRLTAPTGESKKVLRDLGLTLEDVDIKSKGLIDVFGELERANINEAQAARLFGQEGINIIRIIRSGKDELQKYRKEITGTTKATSMYKEQTENSKGSMDKLISSVQELALKFGESLDPAVKSSLDLLREYVGVLNANVGIIESLSASVVNVIFTFGKNISEVLQFAIKSISSGISGLIKGLVTIGGSVIWGILEIVNQSLNFIVDKVFDITDYVSKLVSEIKVPEFVPFAKKINGVIKSLGDSFSGASEKTRSFVEGFTDLSSTSDRLKATLGRLGKSTTSDFENIGTAWQNMKEKIEQNNLFGASIEDAIFTNQPGKKSPEDKDKNLPKKAQEETEETNQIFSKFFKDLNDKFSLSEDDIKSWADGFTDSFATSLMEGKLMFDDFFKHILHQLLQLEIQKRITAPIFKSLGYDIFSNNSSGSSGNEIEIEGRAIGGPVRANTPYIVGEKGPELYIPNQSGSIVPNNKLGGGGGNVQVNIINNAPVEIEQTTRTDSNGINIVDLTINAVKDAMNRGKFDKEMSRYGLSTRPGY